MKVALLVFFTVVIMVVVLCLISSFGKESVTKEKTSKSTMEYKKKLLEDAYKDYTDVNTRIQYQEHNFEWNFYTDKLDARWSVNSRKYVITLVGRSSATSDVNSFNEFISLSDIEYATIYILGANISVLHRYTNPDDVKKLIECVNTINYNTYKEVKHKKK